MPSSLRVSKRSLMPVSTGNAHTSMAAKHTLGALQPDGRRVAEPSFDPVHVAQTIVHIASLPNSVTVLEVNVMCAFLYPFFQFFADPIF